MKTKVLSYTVMVTLLIGFFTSCDTTSTDAEPGKGNVELQFKTISSSSLAKSAMKTADSLIIDGTNGTMQIDDIRFIVAEFELEPADADDDSTDLEDLEMGPFFVDLPLGGDVLNLANSQIKAGLYEDLDFEIEDLDFGDEDDEELDERQALADSIRIDFPEWPDEASMILTGTFTPTDGNPQPFKVFAEAEIEIEREFEPPLEVTEDNVQQLVAIPFNPAKWFEQTDGSVLDLSQYDWDTTQQLLEFEAEFENGIEKVEVEDDDEEDDD